MVASYAKRFLYKSVAVCAFLIVLSPPPLMLFAQQYTIGSFKELDRWYEVSLGNSKVGYAHSLMRMKDNKVYSESVFNLSIKRAGIPIESHALLKKR